MSEGTWLPQKSRNKAGVGARVRVLWPSEALPKGGICDGWREGVVEVGHKVRLDVGGLVDLPTSGFQLQVRMASPWERRKF